MAEGRGRGRPKKQPLTSISGGTNGEEKARWIKLKGKLAVGVGGKNNGTVSGPGAYVYSDLYVYDAAETEFLKAVGAYKAKYKRVYLANTELFRIMLSLGYRKVEVQDESEGVTDGAGGSDAKGSEPITRRCGQAGDDADNGGGGDQGDGEGDAGRG